MSLLMLTGWASAKAWLSANKKPLLQVALCLLFAALVALFLWSLVSGARAYERRTCQMHMSNQRADRVEQAARSYERGVKDGQLAVQSLNEQLLTMREQNETLKERLANVPRFVKTTVCPDPGRAHLTAGSVRQLNTALGYPGLRAGACGPDGTPAPACAADSGISIEQLERNAQRNYTASAEIRARCQALIDYVRKIGEDNVSRQ